MRETGIDDPAEVVRLINSGQWTVRLSQRSWHEDDESISFTVQIKIDAIDLKNKSWLNYLKRCGSVVWPFAEDIISPLEINTKDGVANEIVILRSELFADNELTSDFILAEAKKRDLVVPSLEEACMVRVGINNFMMNQARLEKIVVMHNPIESIRGLSRLVISHYARPSCDVALYPSEDFLHLSVRELGFAFVRAKSE